VTFVDTVTANRYDGKYVLFKKSNSNQKGGCPDTLDTPWMRPWLN